MNKNLVIKCKQDGIYGRLYMFGYNGIYAATRPAYFVARHLNYETLERICIAAERQVRIESRRSIAAREANECPEIRGYNDDRYDIVADFHATIHNIILNKFGVEPCRA